MRCALLMTSVLLAASVFGAEPTTAPSSLDAASFLTSAGKDWHLTFNDEFTGNALDQTKWSIGLPWGGTDGTGRHHNDQYASYVMDHNIVVEGGVLKLLTRREDVTAKNGRVFHFTEGLITTAKNFRQQYGYFEARVKIPVEAGPGMWPAFWTLAEGWPPEMDICEVWTATNRNHQGMAYRAAGERRVQWDDRITWSPLPLGWNTYGMEWGPGYQLYNVNGQITVRVFGDHVNNDKHYILLNSGIASDNLPTAATIFPNGFEVDYVRVYARPQVAVIHNGDFEQDDIRPWKKTGQVVHIAYDVHGGKHALRIDAGGASEQKIYGLQPNATYSLSGWIKPIGEGSEVRLGVKEYGGDDIFSRAGAGEYQQLQVEFKTGANPTTAIIYCTVSSKMGAAILDDVTITQK
jgi:beta-glucanase (GH16 family)